MNRLHNMQKNRGFTVLIAIVIASIVIAIALSIMAITLKQLTLAGIARESEIAFQAANAGVECVRFYDISESNGDRFDVPGNGGAQGSPVAIQCLDGVSTTIAGVASGEEQHFDWTWDGGLVCTDVSIYKFYDTSDGVPVVIDGEQIRSDCPAGVECTVVKARGYNVPCNATDSSRVVERELTVIY